MSWADTVRRMDRKVLKHFGQPTTYRPDGGDPVTVTGVFDETFRLVETGHSDVQSTAPAVWYRLADLPVDPEEDTPRIEIGDHEYRVVMKQKDGQGGVRLILQQVD